MTTTGDQERRSSREIENSGTVVESCPKRMVYGPCGGVRAGGICEVDDRPCPFVDAALVRWTGPSVDGPARAVPSRAGGLIVTDLRVRPFDRRSIGDVVARLRASSDLLLVGDHHSRPDFPPSFIAEAIIDHGGSPWVTLSCRDRNRVVLESELAALDEVGVAGVHCVTGDARAPSVRTDATQVFDLDSLRLAALARRTGLCTSVAATPAAPPLALRAARIVEKERAGAQLCFVNHAGGVRPVARFVAACRAAGATVGFIPCVAVVTDRESLTVLEQFPGLVLGPATRDLVGRSDDLRQAGIDTAVEQARAMLAIEGVVGVNLSGSATSGSELESAAIMAEIAGRLRDDPGVVRDHDGANLRLGDGSQPWSLHR